MLIIIIALLIVNAIITWMSLAGIYARNDKTNRRITGHEDDEDSHELDELRDLVGEDEREFELLEDYLGVELVEPEDPPQPQPRHYQRRPGLNEHKKEAAR